VPEEDPPNIQAKLREAFGSFMTSGDSALISVLEWGLEYALFRKLPDLPAQVLAGDLQFEFVYDLRALFNGTIVDGAWNGQSGTSSLWLIQWLDDQGIGTEALIAMGGRDRNRVLSDRVQYRTGISDLRIAVTPSLARQILPISLQLAAFTRHDESVHLRHLIFVLVAFCPIEWFGPSFSIELRQRLRNDFVDRNCELYPEEAERWEKVRTTFPFQDADGGVDTEFVPTLADAPAMQDTLGREVFAQVLAGRIRQVRAGLERKGGAKTESADRAFMLHMGGPWGSGKSSVLNFLKADLETSGWLVVEFNAWRNQHRRPAWLPLILEVRNQVARQFNRRTLLVWLSWFWWRLRMDWTPYFLAAVLIAIAGFLAWWAGVGDEPDPLIDASEALKALGAIIAALISLLAVARGFALGSQRNAEAYLETKSEPFRRIIRLFELLVNQARQPIAVFIDDLDRSNGTYVTDLLEGIQTSLRAVPIIYVVVGDHRWICSSFEKKYAGIGDEIGAPGRPLGYLFLDKIFQLSTTLPQLSAQRQVQYWRDLLERNDGASPNAERAERRRLAEKASDTLKGKTRHEDIQQAVEATAAGSMEYEAMLAAAAKQITSPESIRAAEHRLQPLAHLLEANPRSMKRLVNAYGLNHARAFLEGRTVTVEALARWTIIELRWPLLAEHLARNWPEIAKGRLVPADYPEAIRALLSNAEVRAVIGAQGDDGQLTVQALKSLLM
jgi:hypothetical protein